MLNTLDNNEDQNYEKNERSIKLTRVYLTRLEQRYMGDGDRRDEPNTSPLGLVNNILFCYEGEKHIGNESERK